MHLLDRESIPAPPCLDLYKHGRDNWASLNDTPQHKEEIREHLERLQGFRCAYCEGPLDLLGQHIEHFRRKHDHPRLTFVWTNLFWSCNQDGHCGCFKDRESGPYEPDDLIDPGVDDPEFFLRFSSDGRIRLVPGLSAYDQHRARETLRVFNLDHDRGPLRRMRESHCAGYKTMGEEIAELAADNSPDEWRPFLESEVQQIRHLPFATAIKHTLTPA
jgi:uncharacterized protein (TIGR02646 family)